MQNWAQDLSRPVWSSVSRGLPGAQAELPADPQRQLDCVPGSRWRRDPRGCPPWCVTSKTVRIFALCPEQMSLGRAGLNGPWDDPGPEDGERAIL